MKHGSGVHQNLHFQHLVKFPNSWKFTKKSVTFPHLMEIMQGSAQLVNIKIEDHDSLFPKSPRTTNLVTCSSSYDFWSIIAKCWIFMKSKTSWFHTATVNFAYFFDLDASWISSNGQHKRWRTLSPLFRMSKSLAFEYIELKIWI